jgi:hypothetical protein
VVREGRRGDIRKGCVGFAQSGRTASCPSRLENLPSRLPHINRKDWLTVITMKRPRKRLPWKGMLLKRESYRDLSTWWSESFYRRKKA